MTINNSASVKPLDFVHFFFITAHFLLLFKSLHNYLNHSIKRQENSLFTGFFLCYPIKSQLCCDGMEAYMGSYLNPGTGVFQMARNSEIFIDKSRLIEETNRHINTIQRFLCVSRPRRFGKSMAADMLAAYYDCKKDTSDFRLLSELKRKYPNNVQCLRRDRTFCVCG